jgi:alkylation response protein AidB-like acyl-CoA dehydrogenase
VSVPGADQPVEGLLDRVRAVTPLIAAKAAEAEAQRKPVDEVIDALKATGVFRSFVPQRYGGYEIDLPTYLDIGLAVAKADPSMGWITTFYMEHNWLLTMFPEQLQDEVLGSQPYVLAPGSINPRDGRAVPLDDGSFSLSGHWSFGTGICHADWVLVSGTVEGDEAGGTRQMLLPVDEVEVKDTWHVDGMAATGSRDIVVTSATVPAHRVSLAIPPQLFSKPGDPYLQRIPIPPFLSLTAAMPALGAAQRALELFEQLTFERIPFGTKRAQSTRVPTQVRLANLRVEVDHAEALMRDVVQRMQAHTAGTIDLDLLGQQHLRLSIAHIVRRCRDAIREMVANSGAKVHYLDHELQRLHRDIHMICAHTVFDVDLVAEGVGRAIVAAKEAELA